MIENGFEVAPETLYELIGTIYRSSDAFVSNFDENYPTIAELADHIVTLAKQARQRAARRLDRQEEARLPPHRTARPAQAAPYRRTDHGRQPRSPWPRHRPRTPRRRAQQTARRRQ
jgi:hypothetical protein